MENMTLYNEFRSVPDTAKKQIGAGRLKGMTDINPMWRIKALTEQFGACGLGWKVVIDKQWTEQCGDSIQSHCNVSLYIKQDGEWSDAICGTGGSKILSKENQGLYSDDEGFKKAFTDALGSACKLLGIGADVYWDKDTESKYTSKKTKQSKNQEDVPADVQKALDYVINGLTVDAIYHQNLANEYYKTADDEGKKALKIVDKFIKESKLKTAEAK